MPTTDDVVDDNGFCALYRLTCAAFFLRSSAAAAAVHDCEKALPLTSGIYHARAAGADAGLPVCRSVAAGGADASAASEAAVGR